MFDDTRLSTELDIKKYDQWLLWDYIDGRKVPMNLWKQPTSWDDKLCWLSFHKACVACEAIGDPVVEGYGFCFTKDDPFIGIDLDGVVDDYGVLDEFGSSIVKDIGTYFEASPSRRGIKIFGRGKIPEGYPNSQRWENGVGIEIYDQGRFFTYTGLNFWRSPEVCADIQPRIDWIFENFYPKPRKRSETTRVAINLDDDIFGLDQRAMSYISHVDLPLPGARNATGFRVAGHLASLTDSNGNRLPEEKVLQYVELWNDQLSVPMDGAEVQRIVRNGMTKGTPREEKPPTILEDAEGPAPDFSQLIANMTSQTTELDKNPTYAIDAFSPNDLSWCPEGFIRRLVEFNLETAPFKQPELALGGAIALLSCLIGRRWRTVSGLHSNLMVLGVAETGDGKGHARSLNKKVLYEAGLEHMVGSERIASGAGIAAQLADGPERLMQIDEIGLLFSCVSKGRVNEAKIVSMLTELYSSSGSIWVGDAYANVKHTPTIEMPHLCIYGTSTPGVLWNSLSTEDLETGFLNRFMVFEGRSVEYQMNSVPRDIPRELIGMAKDVGTWAPENAGNLEALHPKPVVCPHANEKVTRMLNEHQRDCHTLHAEDSPTVRSIWVRVAERTRKLALLFAISRATERRLLDEVQVTEEDVEFAISISERSAQRMAIRVDWSVYGNPLEKKVKRVFDIVRSEGIHGVTQTELKRKLTSSCGSYKEAGELINELVNMGSLNAHRVRTGGRVALKIFLP